MDPKMNPAHQTQVETRKRISTVVYGCSVNMNFPITADNQALERAKDILISSYFDLHCGKEPRKEGRTHGISSNYNI
jgi:predicted deacylase